MENLLNNNTLNKHFGTNNIVVPKLANNKLNLKLILEVQNLTKIRQNTHIKLFESETLVNSSNINIGIENNNTSSMQIKPIYFHKQITASKFSLCVIPKNIFFNYPLHTLKLLQTTSNFHLNDVSYNRYFRDVLFNKINFFLQKTQKFNFFSPIQEFPFDHCPLFNRYQFITRVIRREALKNGFATIQVSVIKRFILSLNSELMFQDLFLLR